MKLIKVVVDNECIDKVRSFLYKEEGASLYDMDIAVFNVDSKGFIAKRNANKIVNDYAVTKLPFVLLCDGDKEYAAVYSEEGDITTERIIKKLQTCQQ